MKKYFSTLVPMLLATGVLLAAVARHDELRGDRVGWVRLRTPSPQWNRHAVGDPPLGDQTPMQFIRDHTTLNIAPEWQQAGPEDLQALCTFPLIFTQEVDSIRRDSDRANLAEYLRRGGFVMIDSCINPTVNPDPDASLERQIGWLAENLPEAKVVTLSLDHPIYHCYFDFPTGHPPHTFHGNVFDPRWDKHKLYGIMIGDRMAGVITLSGLQCGWARRNVPAGHGEQCMKMLVNIYVHAMMQPN